MLKSSNVRAGTLLAIGISSVMRCVARRAPRMLVESPASYAAIYAFSDLQWQRALDYKPGGDVSDLDPYLAPLIV